MDEQTHCTERKEHHCPKQKVSNREQTVVSFVFKFSIKFSSEPEIPELWKKTVTAVHIRFALNQLLF